MNREDLPDLEIAVIGMAGRFPGADSVDAFWRNLLAGTESIRDLTGDELRAAGVAESDLADGRLVRRAADVHGIELFDAALFGFTPREAELMDPQFRVFLEDAWTALEDAARHADGHRLRVGVFAGGSPNSYFHNNIASHRRAAEAVGGFQVAIGNERDYLATHVSYRLNLRGPSVVVQTACSTSLVAVHLACQSLLGGECDIALAGGVSIAVPQTAGYLYEEGGIASPDGRCRPFDAAAAGCVKGNGSGVVVLRRLGDARTDRDRIRAVIKGSAVNNDGSAKIGFTAPSEEGQAAVIAEALAAAGVEPASIGYVEAHGTATALGDPVEVAALTRAFGGGAMPNGSCALGSVKSNVGHLDAAAGVAGLIKTVLALEHGVIPPSLHFQQPNPKIDFASSPFIVGAQARPWPGGGSPRRAGVSSFGIGGTNAHVILEQAPAAEPASPTRRAAQLLTLSGATESAVVAGAAALAAHLQAQPTLELSDVAYVLQTGRRRLAWRRSVVARDSQEAIAALSGASRAPAPVQDVRRNAEVAFLFPGQGAQQVGMARGLYDSEPVYARCFDRCAQLLQPLLGLDLREVVYPDVSSSDAAALAAAEERLRSTALAQPALFAVMYSMAQLWMSWGVVPSAMVGHSLGEYVAACLAGVLSLEDALAVVAERGRWMGSMPGGSMLAVGLTQAQLESRLADHPTLSLAAVNGSTSCVASGPHDATSRLERELTQAGVGARGLRTSHAFHSAMMDPMLAPFEQRLARVRWNPPTIPFLSNLTGTWIEAAQATDPAYWTAHLRRTVRFADDIAALAQDASRVWLEVGPGTVLSDLARPQAPQQTIVASLRRARSASGDSVDGDADPRAMLEALGRLWCAGVAIDWEAFHAGHGRRRVAAPTYPFQRARHWIEPGPPLDATETAARAADTPGNSDKPGTSDKHPDLAEWFYLPGWRRSFLPRAAAGAEPPWLVFDDDSPLARAVIDTASARGARVATVRPAARYTCPDGRNFSIDPRRREDYDALARQLRERDAIPGRVVHFWCRQAAQADTMDLDHGFHAVLHTLQALGQQGVSQLRVALVTQGLFDVAGEVVTGPERATLIGVSRVAQQEYAGLTCRVIDLDGEVVADPAAIVAELDSADRTAVVAWRGGHRWVPDHTRARQESAAGAPEFCVAGGVYVLTGGTGAFELALAARLAERGARAIALLECGDDAEDNVASLHARGLAVQCLPARVVDAAAVEQALGRIRSTFGRLDTVFHTAGAIGGGLIQLKSRADVDAVMAPRIAGTCTLAGALGAGERLVLCGSAISATGVLGQVDFCAASAFLDAFAHARAHVDGPRVVAIDWGTAHWDRWQAAAGPGAEGLLEQLRAIQDSVGITVAEGVEALERALALGQRQVVVSPQDFQQLAARSAAASVLEFLEGVDGAAPPRVDRGGREIVMPRTPTERRVAQAWSELLGIAPIGRDDNFFEVGGNSLLAIQLASQLRKAFDIELTIASLFEAPDLASLAAKVDVALEERRQAEEAARLLDEIEGLSEAEVLAALAAEAAPAKAPPAPRAMAAADGAPREGSA